VKCETKPISGGERLGDRLSKQTQSGVPRREEGCHREQTKPTLGDLGYLENGVEGLAQTNPIWRDARGGLPPRACAGRLYKQTQFRRAATGLAVQTNPICPRRMGRRGRGWSLCAKQTNCPKRGTEAESAVAASGSPPLFPYSSIPVRCLSCKTKPISDPSDRPDGLGIRHRMPATPIPNRRRRQG
jgi:hypothetical protein